jgi:hypothetical protein
MDGNGHNATTVITATFDPTTGQVGFNAPINNEMVLLYMLEKAKDAVKAFIAEQAKGQRIVPAKAMPFIQH